MPNGGVGGMPIPLPLLRGFLWMRCLATVSKVGSVRAVQAMP
jgi:hypothetical protein